MNVVRAWLRLELRRRWGSLVVLVLLIALSTATVLTAVAGLASPQCGDGECP